SEGSVQSTVATTADGVSDSFSPATHSGTAKIASNRQEVNDQTAKRCIFAPRKVRKPRSKGNCTFPHSFNTGQAGSVTSFPAPRSLHSAQGDRYARALSPAQRRRVPAASVA